MMRKYSPRRASQRWLAGAPEYILDCFDHPQFADRYTIWFGKSEAIHTRSDGSIGQGPDQYHNTWLRGLGTSETGDVSGSLEQATHDVAQYRYRMKHKRIRWQDLPDATRALVARFMESE